MIKFVTITNPKGEALVLELTNPEKSGIYVQSIEGLGPPKATINGNGLATMDGMYFSSARAESRNIIFNLGMLSRDRDSLYGSLSIEESRKLIYRYFPLKKEIKVTVATDLQVLSISGYVESNELNMFSKDEACTISVVCPNPYWFEAGDAKTTFSGIQPVFELPFFNDFLDYNPSDKYWSKSELFPMTGGILELSNIEFGQIWLDTTANLNYRGTVDTGIVITIHAFGPCKDISLFNVDTKERIVIYTSKIKTITKEDFHAKDDIIISTVKGDRYCKLLRYGVYTNIIGALSADSDWFQVSNGDNFFGFSAESGANNISVTFSYKNLYMGV